MALGVKPAELFDQPRREIRLTKRGNPSPRSVGDAASFPCRHSFDALLCTLENLHSYSIGDSNRERERCSFPAKISNIVVIALPSSAQRESLLRARHHCDGP